MKQLDNEDIEKLQCFASTTILADVKQKLRRMRITADTQEIMAEIWNQFAYLVNNYKDGSKSVTSYCFEYAARRVVDQFKRERDLENKHVEFDEEMIGATMKNPSTYMIEKEEAVMLDDRVKSVLMSMNGTDLQIAKMYLHGMTLEQIGDYFGITKQAVLKRLRKHAAK